MERPLVLLSQWFMGLLALASSGGAVIAADIPDATQSSIPIMVFIAAIAATATLTWGLARVWNSRESRLATVEQKLDRILNGECGIPSKKKKG